jgi:hypothetical protein
MLIPQESGQFSVHELCKFMHSGESPCAIPRLLLTPTQPSDNGLLVEFSLKAGDEGSRLLSIFHLHAMVFQCSKMASKAVKEFSGGSRTLVSRLKSVDLTVDLFDDHVVAAESSFQRHASFGVVSVSRPELTNELVGFTCAAPNQIFELVGVGEIRLATHVGVKGL